MKIKVLVVLVYIFSFVAYSQNANAQMVNIDLATSPTADFTFDNIFKLNYGIVLPNAITLNVEAVGTQWDLYVGTVTTIAGMWDNASYYTSTGNGSIPVGILQMRVHNLSNTPQISGYVPLQDIAVSTLDIIGDHLVAPDPAVNCSDLINTGTNTAGVLDPRGASLDRQEPRDHEQQ